MSVPLKKAVKIGALAVAGIILIVAAVVALFIFDKPLVKNIVQRYAANKMRIGLTIGRLDYKLSPLRIVASSLKISYAAKVFTLNIAADRVEALGDLRKLIAGNLPAFESIDLEIAELRLDQREISPKPIDFEGLVRQAAGAFEYTKRLSAKCARLVALLPSQDIRLDSLTLTVDRGGSSDSFGLKLACESFAGSANRGRLSVGGALEADAALTLGPTFAFDLGLSVAGPRFVSAGRAAAVRDLSAKIQGEWQPKTGRVAASRLALTVPGLALLDASLLANTRPLAESSGSPGSPDNQLRGTSSGPGSPILTAEARVDIESLESLALLLKPFLPQTFPAARIRGKARLAGSFARRSNQGPTPGTISAELETEGVRFELDEPAGPLRGELSGSLRLDGALDDPRGSGEVHLLLQKLSGFGAAVLESSARLRFKGSRKSAEVTASAGKLKGVSIPSPGHKSLEFAEIDFSGTAGASLGNLPGAKVRIEARVPGLSPIRAAGAFGLKPLTLVRADLETRGQPIPAIRGLLSPFLPVSLAPWTLDGAVDATFKVDGPPLSGRPVPFSGEVTLSRCKFNDPDFVVAGDKLRSSLSARGTYVPATRSFALTATLSLDRGELLWKRFYISWDKFPLRAEVAGRYDGSAASLEDLAVSVALPSLGEVRASGRFGLGIPTEFNLRTSVRFSLGPTFEILAGGGASSNGALAFEGEAAGELDVRKTRGDFSLAGRLNLGKVSIRSARSGTSVQGLEAELPIDLMVGKTPSAETRANPGAHGTLEVAEIGTPNFTLRPPPLVLTVRRNAYEIAPFSLELFGSRLEFGKISLAVGTAPFGFEGTTSFKLGDLDLSRLPFFRAGSSPPGKVRADFPKIDLTPSAVRASGRAEVEIFGGRVVIRNLSVADPFAAGREIGCDVDLLDLDLKKITSLVPFGEVTGIIRGEVRDLAIAYGQPERFELNLESVKRKGVPRTFSLKAVNSLTVLTSGQQATQGSGPFWLRLIHGFRYEKIGVASTLRNDTFTIDGTIRENGVEYLVKRPALFGIDVIDRDPGKAISFKDMMGRLSRIGQSGPPVVR
jgi:hypothetical protein